MTKKQTRWNIPAQLKNKLILSSVLFFLFLIFAGIALANPKWGMAYSAAEYRRGLDAVFAIDVSRSMDIRDLQSLQQSSQQSSQKSGDGNRLSDRTGRHSRLDRGVFIARESILSVPGVRFATAIGRGNGYLAVPLTYDYEAPIAFLESLDRFSMTGRSTNLEALIDAAADAFLSTSPARKAIILVSDGEPHFGNIRNALNRCYRENIAIAAVAIGSDAGAPVPGAEPPAPISRRDVTVMRMAAERTGGIYIDGNREDAASVLAAYLNSISSTAGTQGGQSEPKQQRGFFVILAIAAYGASKFIPRLKLRKNRITASIAALVLMLSSCAEGKLTGLRLLIEANYLYSLGRYDEAAVPYFKALDHEAAAPYAEYGLALTYYTMDESDIALNYYTNSKERLNLLSGNEHHELRYRVIYNSGIIYFEDGDYDAAAIAFREALRHDPGRIEAKRNLEIALMSITQDISQERQPETHNETKEMIFQTIREQEQNYWQSREWEPEAPFGPDW